MSEVTPVEVECIIRHETDKAILIDVPKLDMIKIWIPLSQVSEIHRTAERDGNDVVAMTPWIAAVKGII